ncbi:MAG: hypothetical protein WA982_03545 [Rubrobacteraceae bacterium]
MGRDRDPDRPLEPGEARAHGNDPDAVRIEGERGVGSGRADDRRRSLGPDIDAEGRSMESGGRREPAGVRRASNDRQRQRQDDSGGDGGSASLARRDSVRWGPIWAGLVTALTTFLLLQLLALGIGLVGIGPSETGGAWVSAILGLIAFFVGGLVAGMTSAVRGAIPGLINGFLVWALGVLVILLLSALGLGQIFGALGSVVGQVGVLQDIQQGGVNAPDVDPTEIASAARIAALGAFFGLLLAAVAAMVGGLIGGGPSEPIGHMAQDNNS